MARRLTRDCDPGQRRTMHSTLDLVTLEVRYAVLHLHKFCAWGKIYRSIITESPRGFSTIRVVADNAGGA